MGLILKNAGQAFSLLLLLGAGTGLIYILRWFWWRINAYTEIVAMISSLIISIYFNFIHDDLHIIELLGWQKLVIGAVLTTIVWLVATFITPPDNTETLRNFVKKVKPGGPGWSKYTEEPSSEPWPIPRGVLCMTLGCIAVYGILIGVGQLLYGNTFGVALLGLSGLSVYGLSRLWK